MVTGDGAARSPKRQARGERRIAEILDAAAAVFARSGYEAATTNAIAAEAGISPGSLYQFFRNKDAIAQALADRFVAQMRTAHDTAFDADGDGSLPLPELIAAMIDPIIEFNLANPGFKALFARTDMPAGLADAARPVQEALLGRVERVVELRAPGRGAIERRLAATVLIRIFQGTIPLVTAAPEGPERDAVVAELKRALTAYLSDLAAST